MTGRPSLPREGAPLPALQAEMERLSTRDVRWRDGRTAVYTFHAGDDLEAVQKAAYTRFMAENGLGPAAFPSLKAMEEAVIGYGLNLLNAPEGAAGAMTSGGTDSITMAVKAARDYARKVKGVTGPLNLVLPRSAHPAFDKAAALMEIEVRRTPLRDMLADAAAMDASADRSTIMIVGSAPNFPYGLIDPIETLSGLAQARDLWLHVDACVGGYMAPFVRMNGADLPAFDFALPGVRSMSADLHKYGYCAKGASTVLFRSEELRRHMTFEVSDWPGGRMTTPTLSGTRPGGPIAAAWAVMNYLGETGYRERHGRVVEARERIEAGVRERGFTVLGRPQLGLIAFHHPHVDALTLWKRMRERGWFTSLTTEPLSLHLMLAPVHAHVVETYLADLDAALAATTAVDQRPVRYGG